MGANVFVAESSILHPATVYGTAGQHDVFIYDYAIPTNGNVLTVRTFTPGEDYIVFANMNGAELDMSSLDDNHGSVGVLFHSNTDRNGPYAAATSIDMRDTPYELDALQHTILGVSDIKYGSTFDIG